MPCDYGKDMKKGGKGGSKGKPFGKGGKMSGGKR